MRANHKHYTPPEVVEDLFTPPAQRVDTSLEAAEKIAPQIRTIRDRIYKLIVDFGGLTVREIEQRSPYLGSTIRPRIRELEGNAPWAEGKLPRRIYRTPEKRLGMRVYKAMP